MPPKKDASKSPAKGARKRSVSRARSKSPGRKGKPAAPKSRGRSKSPGRKSKAAKTASPSPAKTRKAKVSLSPPAKKATSPKRTKHASSPPRKYKQSPSPAVEKKQTRGRRSVAPTAAAVAERASELASSVSKKVSEVKDTLKKKATETKEKLTTVSETITTKREKKEEKTEKKSSSKHYEFGGPVGAFLLTLLLPTIIIVVNIACTKKSCTVTHLPEIPTNGSSYYDVNASQSFGLWFVAQVVFAALPLGRVKEGLPLSSGKRLKYRCNGFLSLLLSAAAFGGLYYIQYPLTKILDAFLPLTVLVIALAFVISILLYIRSRYQHGNKLAAAEGNTGNVLYDFFVGRELNPRIRSFDFKIFIEVHFGLIAWAWLNATLVLKAYQETGTFPPTLLLVTGCQLIYIADALWFEENVLSMMDIASDGLGFMNVLGNMGWVPFLYTLQGRYLLDHPQNWSYWALGGFFVLYLIGFFIFRGSNWQKHVFLTNPHHRSVAALETIPGTSGHRLLVGGWWGICRHPNYLGDLIIALAWTLPCGFNTPLPYFYPLNLLFLLIHRASRDGRKCRQKFGASAWDRYCQRVKYRIVPYIY